MQNSLYSGDAFGGPYWSSFPGAFNNTNGLFNVNDGESTPPAQQLVNAQGTSLLNSTISASATSLSVTGQLQASLAGTGTTVNGAGAAADWSSYSQVDITFTIDQPFSYSLQATTSQNRNVADQNSTAFVALGHSGLFGGVSTPDSSSGGYFRIQYLP